MTDTTRESVEALADRLDGATFIVNQNDYMELVEVSPVLRALLSERDAARTALAAAEAREGELREALEAITKKDTHAQGGGMAPDFEGPCAQLARAALKKVEVQ